MREPRSLQKQVLHIMCSYGIKLLIMRV